MIDSGLLEFMQNNITRNLVDYVYGVETGIDSSGRKNCSGTTMENIVSCYVENLVDDEGNFLTCSQASANYIHAQWGVEVPVDKSNRRFDEANNHVYLLETNYYGGGGSKLKSVSGEFSELNDFLKIKDNLTFIWVTDGQGWHTAKLPLAEAFDKIDNIFNLDMLQKGYLEQLVLGK